ncbi:hypothetical protein RQP46_010043 [Phenoliferia psychrophenolica]
MSFKPRSVSTKKKVFPPLDTPVDTPEPVTDSTTAAADSAPPEASTSAAPPPPPPPPAPLVPRAVVKKKPPAPRPPPPASAAPLASTSASAAVAPPRPEAKAATKADPKEAERLELLLWTAEASMSDWGLSMHQGSGLFARLRDSKDGFVHIQQLLVLDNVQALAPSQLELQKALRSRPSHLLKISDSGFQVGRLVKPDFAHLAKLQPEDWDPLYLYLENIPPHTSGAHTSATLAPFLSSILSTSIQRVILPPLFDPTTASTTTPSDDPAGQSEAFAQSLKERAGIPNRTPLPTGGGPYKGFAFVLVGSSEDKDRILKEWTWEIPVLEKREVVRREGESEVDRIVREELEAMEVDSPMAKVEDEEEPSPSNKAQKAARQSGLRSLSYKRWLELKAEYTTYQASLVTLREARTRRRDEPSSSAPNTNRSSVSQGARPDARSTSRWNQSQSQDGPSEARSVAKWGHESFESRQQHPPRPPVPRRPRTQDPAPVDGPPSPPGVELDAEEAVDVRGAFPKGCVLWIRNIHFKSTRSSLRSLFTDVLEELEEASGKGVEFVDYDKGLDTCHLRLASSHLASLIHGHFSSAALVQTGSTELTPLSSAPVDPSDPPRPLKSEILEGTRERLYWEGLPEATRKSARKAAGGPAAIAEVGKKRKRADEPVDPRVIKQALIKEIIEPVVSAAAEAATVVEEASPERPRKKASRF